MQLRYRMFDYRYAVRFEQLGRPGRYGDRCATYDR